MHKLTSITYLIASLPKKHNQKMTRNCLFIPSGNSYSPSSFVIFQRGYVPIFPSSWAKTCRKMFALWKIRIYDRLYRGLYEKKNAQNQHLWSFLIKTPIKKFSEKALFDHNMTHHKNFKNIYNRNRTTPSKASNSSLLTCPCSYSCNFSMRF